jgi:type 2 lantibiotic biosynthesis protein LanM
MSGLALWGAATPPPLQEIVPFADLLWCFCESASRLMLRLRMGTMWADLPAEARVSAQTHLLKRLAAVCQWCLYQRYDGWRQTHGPNSLYSRFVEIAASTRWANVFFTEFAGLARPIGTCVLQWLNMMDELLERWQYDSGRVRQLVGAPPDARLAYFESFPSDPHRHGRSVAILRLTSSHRAVYKPLSGALSEFWGRAVEATFATDHSSPEVILGDDYSWHRFVEARDSGTTLEASLDISGLGRLLALATALGSSDIHFENLILTAQGPQLIDHETVLSPGFRPRPGSASLADRSAMLAMGRSALNTGALPQWLSGPAGSVWNVNVVGWDDKGEAPELFPRIIDANADRMRISRELDPGSRRASVPARDASSFGAALAAAFADGRESIIQAQLELDSLIGECVGRKVRVVLRDTRFYAELLGHGFMPAYCHDVLDRSLLFERLYRPLLAAGAGSHEWDLCRDEHEALIRLDIPYFESPVDELVIGEASGSNSRLRPAGDAPLRHGQAALRAMVSREGAGNARLVRAAFESAAWPEVAVHPVDPPVQPRRPASTRLRLRHHVARELYRMLHEALFRSRRDHSVALIGPSLRGTGRTQQLGLCEPSDTYSGIAGVGLLAAGLHRCGLERSARAMAHDVAHSLMLAGERLRSEQARNASDGAFTGPTGVAFALAKIGELLEEVAYVEAAGSLLQSARTVGTFDQQGLDVISGVAGTALVTAAISVIYPPVGPAVRPSLVEIREILLSSAVRSGDGCGARTWPSMGVEEGVSGFAHGAAGISAALARLQRAGAGPAADCVEGGLHTEMELYDPVATGWPTIQGPAQTHHAFGSAWCYGSPGILVAAAEATAAGVAVDAMLIERAVAGTFASEPDGDGLCHGRTGVALAAMRAGRVFGDAELQRAGVRRLDEIATRYGMSGLRLEPVSELRYAGGLMCGASGVGLALLAPELDPFVANLLAVA